MKAVEQFISNFNAAFRAGELLKCTLGKPQPGAAPDLKNIYVRPVVIKGGLKVSFNYRYKTRDEVHNFSIEEAVAQLEHLLGKAFMNADLFTANGDCSLLFSKKGEASLIAKKSAQPVKSIVEHNREKVRLLDPSAPWLHALGITNAAGVVLPGSQDKWRQINKFLEIIAALLKSHPLPVGARIADMGSGKGYLTFALYDYLANNLQLDPQVTGIELRQGLVEFCNQTAGQAGLKGLRFVAADIKDFESEGLDMLIALHACDIATDLALAKGIQSGAHILVVAPCCHKQIRKELGTRNELAPLLRYGILEERQAEIVTDGIRALLLEANGYKTNVFEFVSTEHTAKNVMITAIEAPLRPGVQQKALLQVAALKEGFGIREHYLEKLLSE
jgi:SAM-dependent methyltransferase